MVQVAASAPDVANLTTGRLASSYTARVYAAVMIVLTLFIALVGFYQFAHGIYVDALAAWGIAVFPAVLAWGIWTNKPWRYRLSAAVHLVGVLLGIYQIARWIAHVVALILADPTIAEAGGTWAAIRAKLPSLPVDTLLLADGILLILLNVGLLFALRYLRQEEAERRIDPTYHSGTELLLRRFLTNNSARVGGSVVVLLLLITYLMPRISPYYGRIVLQDGDLSSRLRPPDCLIGWLRLQQGVDRWQGEGPQPTSLAEFPCEHPFGFDKNGRDVTRRVLHGISVSLGISIIAVGISVFAGVSIGLTAGYLGGWVDSLLMRLMDIMLAFPALLLAIAIVAMRGPGLENAMIAIGITGVPAYARLARSMSIALREQEFVTAARGLGATERRILSQHILPNSLAPLIVQATLGLGSAVIQAAALGFLGLGQQPPFPELGKMLAESREVMTSGQWWVMLFPGLAVMMIVLGFNLLGDALRDTLDPKLRGT